MEDSTISAPYVNAQGWGVLSSLVIHACLILLLLVIPNVKPIAVSKVIQVSLEPQAVSLLAGAQEDNRPISQLKKQIHVRKDVSREIPPINKLVKNAPVEPAAPAAQPEPIQKTEPTEVHDVPSVVSVPSAGSPNATQTGIQLTGHETAASEGRRGHASIPETQFGQSGAPAFLHRVDPEYPFLARRLGKEGRVVLRLLIDRYGKLQDVEVIEGAGFGFSEAAIAAVKKSTFAPAYTNGEKIAMRAILSVLFHLKREE